MKKIALVCVFLLVVVFGINRLRVQSTNTNNVISSSQLFEDVNQWRATENKPAFIENAELCSLATVRLEEIQDDWSHDGFLPKANPLVEQKKFVMLGENLASQYQAGDEKLILNTWLLSPSHKANLDADFTQSCMKCDDDSCVQIFAK